MKVKTKVAQSYLTLCDPMDCSLPAASVLGILQARRLEWVAVLFSRFPWICLVILGQTGEVGAGI